MSKGSKAFVRKPDAGNLPVRFDKGEGDSLLYSTGSVRTVVCEDGSQSDSLLRDLEGNNGEKRLPIKIYYT